MTKATWKLKPGADRRVRGGHPWVYSNELSESPKGLIAGSLVELQDAGGGFVARGYGNPSSLIAFRVLSRDPKNYDPASSDALTARLAAAAKLRFAGGFAGLSHRLCYGEADGIPGLIIDRYRLSGREGQVFSVQAHTAGAQRMLEAVFHALEKLNENLDDRLPWENSAIVVRNDLNVRKYEGLEPEDPKIFKTDRELTDVKILIRSASGGAPLAMATDLLHGQKTGFFLDQFSNIETLCRRLETGGARPRILDLCCYVGQWSAQLARALGGKADVTVADASAKALEFAKRNVESEGAKCELAKIDVMDDLPKFEPRHYDIVICDPPALIKGRKDLAAGSRGYLKLNTNAMKLLKPSGLFVSCSCSALFEEPEFVSMLAGAGVRSQTQIKWIGRGSPSPDHPLLAEFKEGHYLKCWIGRSTDSVVETRQVQPSD